uniref:Uncharacterized protein n=1 Tax=Sus scrofa TaxID=9823 RepID=A0A8D1C1Q9_PIG
QWVKDPALLLQCLQSLLWHRSPCIFSLPGCAKGGISGQRNPEHDRKPTGIGAETGPG